jgi:hypothetical protein
MLVYLWDGKGAQNDYQNMLFAALVGVALFAGCSNRVNPPSSATTVYETGSGSDGSGTITETQKKARGSSETGNIDGAGNNQRSSSD